MALNSDQNTKYQINVPLHNPSLAMKVYHKKMDDKMYLHYNSAHPKSQKDVVPYSLFIRCKRICTEKRHFFMEVQDITQKLAHRGYPHELIAKSFLKSVVHPNAMTPPLPLMWRSCHRGSL